MTGRGPRARTGKARTLRARVFGPRAPEVWIPRQRIPPSRTPSARRPVAGSGTRPAPPRRERDFLDALWQILVTMGGAWVPLPVEYADDPQDPGRSDPR
ncbi:hypothetical protein [Streptomyces sp. NBC_01198]|uniref:hypothetical protein n=1 Tax=Streptomyces sp. NBC_01198 TaxID=2903769 RepID=UPI002E14F20F|nr:hypothetical protein OG702_21330 [Streptomyces sp. NBC_01198]